MKKLLILFLLFSATVAEGQGPSLPEFFRDLTDRYLEPFSERDRVRFDSVCRVNFIDRRDSSNIRKYYTISILHQLFTCESCTDGSQGEILNIPYFWHYCTPNPRHRIRVDGKQNISYVNIERKPSVFLKDMVALRERFSHPDFGTFSTFGWCSEREMAFALLLRLMGYDAHVIAPGSHAHTEIVLDLVAVGGYPKTFLVSIDNTFDDLYYSRDTPTERNNIYEKRAFAAEEVAKVKGITVSREASRRIEEACTAYLNSR